MSGYLPGEAAYRRVTLSLSLAGVTTFALLYAPQALLPELAEAFDVPAGQAALSISVTTLVMAAALLGVGPLTERVGRTPVIIASVFATSILGLCLALAPSWPALLAIRAAQGVALPGMAAVAMAYLREEIAPEAHGQATGAYIGGTAIGGMLGRFVVGGVEPWAGWRWALAAVGLVGLGCAIVVRLILPASQGFRPAPREAGGGHRTLRRLLTDPALVALYGIGAVSMGAFIATFNTIGFRLREAPYSLGVAVSSLVYLAYAPGSAVAAYAGRLADRLGRRAVLPVAVAAMLAGLLLTLATPLWVLLLGLTMFAGCFFGVHGLASGWVAARAQLGGGGIGQATAFYLVAYYLGSSLFGWFGGRAWGNGGWPELVAVAGVLVTIALVLAWWLTRIPKLTEPPAADPGVTAY